MPLQALGKSRKEQKEQKEQAAISGLAKKPKKAALAVPRASNLQPPPSKAITKQAPKKRAKCGPTSAPVVTSHPHHALPASCDRSPTPRAASQL